MQPVRNFDSPWRHARLLLCAVLAFYMVSTNAIAGPGEPALPEGRDPGGVAVALIDSGVNYTLPHIAKVLARDEKGALLGYDFADDDRLPFDIVPGRKGPIQLHHGTSVASILAAEAPRARLVPYRYRANDYESFARIVEHIAKGPAQIAVMALGGYREADWQAFRRAALAHPEILFVISAGNDGHNLDEKPVYPAAFRLANSIVVTSTDDFGRIPGDSNWGVETVDISTPGEQLTTRDHLGALKKASGSSYAVPRIAALAARLKAENESWTTGELKQAVVGLAAPSPGERRPRTRYGWIANPALAGPPPR